MDNISKLNKYLKDLAPGGLCVAFSGGVDSAVLLKAACNACDNVHAVMLSTVFHSPREPEAARHFAEGSGSRFTLLNLNLPSEVMDNPKDRCYLCKKTIFTAIFDYSAQNGLATVLDGTNSDDLNEYRPGLRALTELGVKSPLAELGITKNQVREIAREFGLPVAEKPSSPCLATRIPYNTRIEPQVLEKIDELEAFLKSHGFAVVRARIHGDIVRIEIPPEKFADMLDIREEIVKAAKNMGFAFFTLDLSGFCSGSFDSAYKLK